MPITHGLFPVSGSVARHRASPAVECTGTPARCHSPHPTKPRANLCRHFPTQTTTVGFNPQSFTPGEPRDCRLNQGVFTAVITVVVFAVLNNPHIAVVSEGASF